MNLFHGTTSILRPGDVLRPPRGKHVYLASTPEAARSWARAKAHRQGHFEVDPDDPDHYATRVTVPLHVYEVEADATGNREGFTAPSAIVQREVNEPRRSNPTPPTGGTFTAYHGTSKRLKRLDPSKGAQHVVWFSGDRETIERGESGAESAAYILELLVTMKHPAGWREYDQLVLDELVSRGYDGAILPRGDSFDGFVFDGSQIEIVNTTALGSKRRSNPSNPAGYEPDRSAPPSGDWDRSGADPVWRQSHEELVVSALRSWKGDPSSMRIHMDDELLGTEAPGSGSGKMMRAQAAALLWELRHSAIPTPTKLYRGSHQAPRGCQPWSESSRVAAIWSKKNGGQVWTLPKGTPGLPIYRYANVMDMNEREWIVCSKKGLFTETGSRLSNPASPPPRSVWDVAEYVRQRFIDSGYSKLRRTHIKVEWSIDSWDDGKRTVAACSADGLRMWVSPRLEEFDRNRQLALLAHEFGHAVQGLYGLEVHDRHDDVERDADALAEYGMGRHLFYAPIDGRLIQTLDSRAPGAVRPRPRGLR